MKRKPILAYLNSNLFRIESYVQSVGLTKGHGNALPNVYRVSADNVGNGYGVFTLSRHIGKSITASNEFASIYSGLTVDPSRKLTIVINRRFSQVVFALQDQIRISTPYPRFFPYEALTNLMRHLDVPVVVASLGIKEKFRFESSYRFARRLDSRLINFLKLLGKKSPFLGVRGFETARFLAQLGIESEVIGCPSMFRRSFEELKSLQNERDRLWPGAEVSGESLLPLRLESAF